VNAESCRLGHQKWGDKKTRRLLTPNVLHADKSMTNFPTKCQHSLLRSSHKSWLCCASCIAQSARLSKCRQTAPTPPQLRLDTFAQQETAQSISLRLRYSYRQSTVQRYGTRSITTCAFLSQITYQAALLLQSLHLIPTPSVYPTPTRTNASSKIQRKSRARDHQLRR
jgi:hypothetical protein